MANNLKNSGLLFFKFVGFQCVCASHDLAPLSAFIFKFMSIFKLHDVPSDPRKAGKCAFASQDIKKCEFICEHEGEVVSIEEAKRRDENYQEQGEMIIRIIAKLDH